LPISGKPEIGVSFRSRKQRSLHSAGTRDRRKTPR